MDEQELAKILENLDEEKKKQLKDEIITNQIKILSAMFDKASAYTNLIIVAGYASFFAIWSFTKEFLSPKALLWSAILMTTSATLFVFFETCKMIVNGISLLSRKTKINNIDKIPDLNEIRKTIDDYEVSTQKSATNWIKFWCFCLIPIVLSGIGGLLILFVGFIRALSALQCK